MPKVVHLIISLVLAIGAAEVYTRTFAPRARLDSLYAVDPLLGWRMRPNARAAFSEEGEAIVETNSAGFRDKERERAKEPLTFRVALLGDSFFEAKQVPFEASIAAQLESRLAHCRGGPVEVLNFSVQGYGTLQQFLLYQNTVREYEPDLVVLGFYEGNDIFNNHPALNPTNPELAPSAKLDHGELRFSTLGESPLYFIHAALYESARYLQFAQHLLEYVQAKWRSSVLTAEEYEWVALRAPLRDEVVTAWDTTERLIEMFQEQISNDSREFLLVSIPPAISVHPDATQREDFRNRYGIVTFDYPVQRIMSQVGMPENTIVSLREPFLEASEKGDALYGFANARPGFGHWNQQGHAVASTVLAQRICARSPSDSAP